MNVPNVTLNDGHTMPQLGFGVWQVSSEEVVPAIQAAIDTGYRSIDTAAIYGNEEGVGKAIRECGVPREQLFITTKLWSDKHDRARVGLEESLERMGLEYVDLYLVHWPKPRQGKYVDAWKGLIECQQAGLTRSIGVSNYTIEHLTEIIEETGVKPTMNQIELHPLFQQDELVNFHTHQGIITESWSPISQGKLADNELLASIGQKYGKTPTQVILRWHMDRGFITIPKSVTPSRIKENFDIFDFKLDGDDMAQIKTLHNGTRLGGDPMVVDW